MLFDDPEHPRVCSCADCIPDRREAFIFTADKDQLPDSIGLTSRFYKHAKNSTWQETCSQENLNEESRFEKTVFEKTRKRKITCRSFCNHTFLFGVAAVFLFRMLAFSHFFFPTSWFWLGKLRRSLQEGLLANKEIVLALNGIAFF